MKYGHWLHDSVRADVRVLGDFVPTRQGSTWVNILWIKRVEFGVLKTHIYCIKILVLRQGMLFLLQYLEKDLWGHCFWSDNSAEFNSIFSGRHPRQSLKWLSAREDFIQFCCRETLRLICLLGKFTKFFDSFLFCAGRQWRGLLASTPFLQDFFGNRIVGLKISLSRSSKPRQSESLLENDLYKTCSKKPRSLEDLEHNTKMAVAGTAGKILQFTTKMWMLFFMKAKNVIASVVITYFYHFLTSLKNRNKCFTIFVCSLYGTHCIIIVGWVSNSFLAVQRLWQPS